MIGKTWGMTLFCEDARQEKSEQTTLVGILPDNIAMPSFPGSMPKLAIFTRINAPIDEAPETLEIFLRWPSGETQQLSVFTPEVLAKAKQDAIDAGNDRIGLISTAVASPFSILELGRLDVGARSGDSEMITGSMTFKVASTLQ